MVAIKCVAKKSLNKASVENLLTEIEILKGIRHPHIVQLKDFQVGPGLGATPVKGAGAKETSNLQPTFPLPPAVGQRQHLPHHGVLRRRGPVPLHPHPQDPAGEGGPGLHAAAG